jgi:UDP-glucose 4-epimerase
VYGDGEQTRDFTYADDAVEANLALLDTDAADGEVMNIGSTDNISIIELARAIRDIIDPSIDIEFDERYEADAEHTHADTSKAHELIGYEPTTTIEEGARKFVEWYRENEDWYDPLVRRS